MAGSIRDVRKTNPLVVECQCGPIGEPIYSYRTPLLERSAGKDYQLNEAHCLPKPTEGAHTPITIGGSGEKRTLPIAAKYAAEWNAMNLPVHVYKKKLAVVEQACTAIDRDPASLRRSMASFGLIGHDLGMLNRVTEYQMKMGGASGSPAAYREKVSDRAGCITGLTSEVVDRLGEYAELGIAEIQFENFNYGSDEFISYLASELAPQVAKIKPATSL